MVVANAAAIFLCRVCCSCGVFVVVDADGFCTSRMLSSYHRRLIEKAQRSFYTAQNLFAAHRKILTSV